MARVASAGALRAIPREDAWRLLRSQSVGRLAIAPGGHPDIVPLNFLARDGHLLLRTRGGGAVAALYVNRFVAFEVDDLSGPTVWSVVIRGNASVLEDPGEIEEARRAPLWTWPSRTTDTFVRLEPTQVTGRTFAR